MAGLPEQVGGKAGSEYLLWLKYLCVKPRLLMRIVDLSNRKKLKVS